MKKTIPLIVSLAFLLVSCTNEVKPEISISRYSAEIDCNGGEVTTMVSSNMNWTASCATDGVSYPTSMKAGDNLVTVKVPSTDSEVTRCITIVFVAKGESTSASATLNITQSPAPYLVIDKTSASVPAVGGEVTVNVESNDVWTVQCTNPYYTIVPETENIGKTKVTITAPANTTGRTISETVTFAMGTLTRTVRISQYAR